MMYAAGGQEKQGDDFSFINVMARYEFKSNVWSAVRNMPTKRSGVGVAVLDGYIYDVGGCNEQGPLNIVERYDPRENLWSEMAPMLARRAHLGCTAFNSMVSAVGVSGPKLSSAERYDPKTRQWNNIDSLVIEKSELGLAVANGQLYAVGGVTGRPSNTAEGTSGESRWNLEAETMRYPRRGLGLTVMPPHFW